jgi:hypothetical protein
LRPTDLLCCFQIEWPSIAPQTQANPCSVKYLEGQHSVKQSPLPRRCLPAKKLLRMLPVINSESILDVAVDLINKTPLSRLKSVVLSCQVKVQASDNPLPLHVTGNKMKDLGGVGWHFGNHAMSDPCRIGSTEVWHQRCQGADAPTGSASHSGYPAQKAV